MINFLKYILPLLVVFCSQFVIAQSEELGVPIEIKNELELKKVVHREVEFQYKVHYPKNYSKHKKYKVYLGLSGGNQFPKVVDYCYYAWFRSTYFEDYIIVLPINTEEESLRDYGNEEILSFLEAIIKTENVTDHGWVLGGTSNGGMAAFNFLNIYPELFSGVILMPGALDNQEEVLKEWKKIQFLLAYGEKDIGWDAMSKATYNHLKKTVKEIDMYIMREQEHVLTPEYDIDQVYKAFFDKK